MIIQVVLNDFTIEASKFKHETEEQQKISFSFTVTHEEYHDVTTLLYENEFFVQVRSKSIVFHAMITNYSTSLANLYIEGEKGEFYVELTEINAQSE